MPTGLFVTHPLTGEQVEVWVGNYVLMSYGDGAVMGVPAHDERDFAFARKYNLPIKQVIGVEGKTYSTDAWQEWYGDKEAGDHQLRQVRRPGLPGRRRRGGRRPGRQGLGEKKVTFRLRDWGISRQRYWGTPIPIIHCPIAATCRCPKGPAGGAAGRLRAGRLRQPAEQARAFLKSTARVRQAGPPRNRHHGHLRGFVLVLHALYLAGQQRRHGRRRNDYWMPMDQYIGGIEHAILHLLYARFWTKVMRDFGLVKFDEPFTNLLTQGMVLNETYYREDAAGKKTWINPADVDLSSTTRAARSRRSEGRRPAGGDRRHREDVQVEEQRRRPASADRPVRRRHRAPVHHVRLAAGADAGMVGRRRGRRLPLPAPRVELRLQQCRAHPQPAPSMPPSWTTAEDPAPRSPQGAASRPTTTSSASSTTPWSRPA
jgi:leucyl-tRNA synthetase